MSTMAWSDAIEKAGPRAAGQRKKEPRPTSTGVARWACEVWVWEGSHARRYLSCIKTQLWYVMTS